MAAHLQSIAKTNVQSRSTAEAGNGLFATRQIELNNTILSVAQPLMVALDTPRLKDTCYHCFLYVGKLGTIKRNDKTKTKTLKACAGCAVVRYCDKECQKSSWTNYHRLECKIYAKLCPKILPNNVRAVVRLLLLQRAKCLPQGEWEQLTQLEAHVEQLRKVGGEPWQNLCLMAKAAKEYSGSTLNEDTILELFCRLMINSFALVTSTYDPLGLVLHPLPALLNHSCDYNAIVRMETGWLYSRTTTKIEVVPLRQIKQGEEILVSYIDANQPYCNRQKELHDRYFFTCQCSKCLQGSAAPTDKFLDGPIPPEVQHVHQIEGRATELLQSAESDTSITGPVQKLKYALHLLEETRVWPIYRFPSPALRHQLILAYLDAHQFNLAFAHAAIQHFKIDPELMTQSHHPLRMVHDWVFVRLMDHIMNPDNNEWASQKLDLVPYKVNMRFWRSYILRDVRRSAQKCSPSSLTDIVSIRHDEIRYLYYSSPDESELNNKEKYAKEYESLEKMINDVLEADRTWQAAG